MNRHASLTAKQAEIQAGLEKWVAAAAILDPDEQLVFTLEIVSRPPVAGTISIPFTDADRYRYAGALYDPELSTPEWNTLLENTTDREVLRVIEFFRRRGNAVATTEEIQDGAELAKNRSFYPGWIEKHGLDWPYPFAFRQSVCTIASLPQSAERTFRIFAKRNTN